MKKTFTTLTTAIIFVAVLVPVLFSTRINADTDATEETTQQCVPGTGGDTGVECEPCIAGPYNICVPDTGIFSTVSSKISEVTEDKGDSIQMIIIYVSTALGAFFLVNGLLIYKKTMDLK